MSNLYIVAIVLLSIAFCMNGQPLADARLEDIQSDADLAVQPALNEGAASLASKGKKGLTFVKEDHLAQFGVDLIGCRNWSDPSGMNCDAYSGDTDCLQYRPVLCARVDDTPRPAYFVLGNGAAMPAYFYAGWNRGHVTTTVPVRGSQFANRAAVDAFCAQSFGANWQVATFHDGYYIAGMNGTTYAGVTWTQNAREQQAGGWHYYSYGNVRNDVRFWVHIRDQPSTCWAQ